MGETRTDAEGKFRFDHAAEGEYAIRMDARIPPIYTEPFKVEDGKVATITVDGQTGRLKYRPAPRAGRSIAGGVGVDAGRRSTSPRSAAASRSAEPVGATRRGTCVPRRAVVRDAGESSCDTAAGHGRCDRRRGIGSSALRAA